MFTKSGVYAIGPDSAVLKVWTGKEGKAARAGHNLEIDVTDWSATLELAAVPEDTAMSLSANSRSLRVFAGHGGMQSLDRDSRSNIDETIDSEVLNGGEITFKSTRVHRLDRGDELHVDGELTLLGKSAPVAFTLTIDDDGHFNAEALLNQSDFAIKPYSALFGTLKVKDELRVSVEGTLQTN
jgi:polyisoprenoid-binding protein YceI